MLSLFLVVLCDAFVLSAEKCQCSDTGYGPAGAGGGSCGVLLTMLWSCLETVITAQLLCSNMLLLVGIVVLAVGPTRLNKMTGV